MNKPDMIYTTAGTVIECYKDESDRWRASVKGFKQHDGQGTSSLFAAQDALWNVMSIPGMRMEYVMALSI